MKELKEIIFERVATELQNYQSMSKAGGRYTEEEISGQKQRFLATYDILQFAGIEEEYYAWKEARA